MRNALSILFFLLAFAPASAAPVPGLRSFTLDNGLTVVVIEDHRAPVVAQMVWYRVGSADDPAGQSGLAHFLEHLMFKATDELRGRRVQPDRRRERRERQRVHLG